MDVNNLSDFVIENDVLKKYIGSSEHVILPEGVRVIHLGAFAENQTMQSITLPESLKKISGAMYCIGAFKDCKSLQEIIIPNQVTEIGKEAFWGCENLHKVYLGKSVEFLSTDAFYGCMNLKEIEIHSENSFYSTCDGLILSKDRKKVKLALPGLTGTYYVPDGIEEISFSAFSACQKLEGIRFSPTVSRIDMHAFANCDALISVVIPETVKEISFGAFSKSNWWSKPKRFEELVISPNAGEIQNGGSFYLGGGDDPVCYPQFPLSFANSTEDKRRLTLGYCLNPETYTEEYAKDYLKYAKSQKRYLLEIAKKKKLKDVEAFYEELEAKEPKKNTKKKIEAQVVLAKTEQANSSEEFELDGEILAKYIGGAEKVIIPDSIKSIAPNAFSGCASVKEVVIPASVEVVGPNVFYDCKKLECVTFLSGVKRIGKKAFVKCPKLKTVIFYSTEMELEFNFYKFRENLEVLAPNMSPASFPTTNRQQVVLSLAKAIAEGRIAKPDVNGKFASYLKRANYQYFPLAESNDALFTLMIDLGALTAKEAPELLELWKEQSAERKIRLMEFSGQKESKQIDTLAVLEDGLSAKAPTVAEMKKEWTYTTIVLDKSVTGTESMKGIELRKYKGFKTEVEVPAYIGKQQVLCIGACAFQNNTNIVKVSIPETIQRIGDSAFSGCTKLESVEHYGEKLSLASYAFKDCSSLAYLHTTANEMSQGIHPFCGCKKLFDQDGYLILDVGEERILCDYNLPISQAELTVPDGVTIIGNYAFGESFFDSALNSNKKLRKINIPASVKRIDGSAFSKAQSLQSVTLQEGLVSIGGMAFFECTSLKHIYIPSSVKEIEDGAFFYCDLTIHGALGTPAQFHAEKNKLAFVVDDGSEQREELVDFVVEGGTLKKYLGMETDVVIPENIHRIGTSSFNENNAIQRLEIGNQVHTIGTYAFSSCNSLAEVKICGNVKVIERCAFQFSEASCVVIEEGVEQIGEWAFGYLNPNGAEVFVPESVIEIGKDAFFSNFGTTKLRVKQGSYAEIYAKENEIPFVAE